MKFLLALAIIINISAITARGDLVRGTLVPNQCGENFNPMTVTLPYVVTSICTGFVVGEYRQVIVIQYIVSSGHKDVKEVFTVLGEKETETGAGAAVSSTTVVNTAGQEAVFVKHLWNHQLVGLRGQTPSGVRFNGSKFHKM